MRRTMASNLDVRKNLIILLSHRICSFNRNQKDEKSELGTSSTTMKKIYLTRPRLMKGILGLINLQSMCQFEIVLLLLRPCLLLLLSEHLSEKVL